MGLRAPYFVKSKNVVQNLNALLNVAQQERDASSSDKKLDKDTDLIMKVLPGYIAELNRFEGECVANDLVTPVTPADAPASHSGRA